MEKEKAGFAQRLRAALEAAGIEASASVVEKRFNSRYEGAPVTAQAISGWLSGRYMPKQDKIRVLAGIVGLDPHQLQYGGRSRIGEKKTDWSEAMGPRDRVMVDSYLSLPTDQRQLVRDLVKMLSGR